MYEVWHFLGWKVMEFAALSAAIEYARCKGFTFQILKGGECIGAVDALGSYHDYAN